MGSSFAKQMCCVICERCRGQQGEAANVESSESQPILRPSGATSAFLGTQPPSPALKVPQQGSKDLQTPSQEPGPWADALEENGDACAAAQPGGRAEEWEAAWNPMDFFVAPADEEFGGEVKDLTQADHQQETMGKTEVEIQSVPGVPEAQAVADTAPGAELRAEEEQPHEPGEPGNEGALCAGITLQERDILSLIEMSSDAEPCQGCEAEPPARSRDVLTGRGLSLAAVQEAQDTEPCPCAEHVEGTDRAQAAHRAELTSVVEAETLLTVQNPSGGRAQAVAELYSTSAVFWESLRPQWGSLEPPAQLFDFLKHELQFNLSAAQSVGSMCWAEPEELSEPLHQPRDGAKCEVGEESSRECEPEPETLAGEQQTVELPEEPAASAPIPAKQEDQFPNVPPSLAEVLGSSGETEAENAEARDV